LEEEGKSTCHLIYGNRNSNTIIFKSALEKLRNKYEGQLFVEHVLSRPILSKQPGISGFFKKPVSVWKGSTGRIDEALLDTYLEEHNIDAKNADFYICGPGPMIENIEKHLKEKVSHSKQVHVEYFSAPLSKGAPTQAAGSGHVEVSLNGKNYQLEVPAEKTILDILIEKGAEPPYSCTSGACSSCMAKVTHGKVSMDACFALDEDEIADGYILTCQAHPQSEQVKIDFDA
jgi:ring-1,2-phenylacetyl-CoA epoxidase subunit PaaE